jgi:hypothetical protein
MHLLLGSATLSATLLLFAWAYASHRRPVPARWTRSNALSVAVTVLCVQMLPIGPGFLAAGMLDPATTLHDLGPLVLAGIVAGPILVWLMFGRLIAQGRAPRVANVNLAPANGEAPVSPRLAA